MKKLLLLSTLLIISIFGYTQTAITNANIQTAVDLWDSDLSAATTTYGNISDWDVSQVTDMSQLFYHNPDFNYDIRNWDVSNVTDMRQMFYEASSFNQPIGNWDVSSVTDMGYMFYYATSLNQDISNWDVGNVTDMVNMFNTASSFNQPIGDWNVSGVANMYAMFYYTSSFNQPIGNWDVSGVTDMSWMFHNAGNFVQDISNWCVSNITSEPTGFSNGTQNFPESYKPVWGTCPSLGIDDQNLTNISIYPNPTDNTLFIIGNKTPIAVSIYNVLGKEVLCIKNTNNINVQALPSGVYVIEISDGVRQTNRKFIKN